MNPFRQLFIGTGQLPAGLRAELMCFSYRAERFREDRSGAVEVRLRTTQAEQVSALLNPAT